MPRIVLGIEYDGSHFSGWQYQTNRRTVQNELEKALSKVANQKIVIYCAGRTDSGVHALEQVIHFNVDIERDLHSWMMGGNANLPMDVRIIWVKLGINDFHARYSAIARFYRYIILNRKMKSALQPSQMTWCYSHLEEEKMHRAAQTLVGMHDFSSFRAQGCQSKSPNRLMHFIQVYREDEKVIIDLSANAFLHHMVRNIAGVLIDVGCGKRSEDWTQELLEVKNRALGGITASPCGLYLGGVYYPDDFGIKKHPVFELLEPNASRFEHPVDKIYLKEKGDLKNIR